MTDSRTSAKILNIKGRQHAVKIFYTAQPQEDFSEAAMKTFFQIHVEQPPGDVLIFLPGMACRSSTRDTLILQ